MSATLDHSEFDKTLAEYVAKVPGRLEQIINRKMYFILRKAWELTPIATRETIERQLNIIGYKLRRSRKTGKISRGRSILGASVLNLIVQARRAKAGLKGLYGKEMAKASSKLAGARLRASGTMRRGWLKPLLAFAAKSKDSVPSDAFGALPKGSGEARPAEAGWSPTAEAAFEVMIEKGARFDPRVEQALQAAFDAEEASMRQYIEEQLEKDLKEMAA